MIGLDDGLYAAMVRRGMTRRSFLKFATAMAGALALPASYAPRIASAVEGAPRLPVIWLRGQDCAGNSETFIAAPKPTIAELMLDLLAIEYHELLMAPAGEDATASLATAMERFPDGYVAVVEGSIPLGADGVYCLIGGRPFADIVREVCAGALATLVVGSCAVDGGVPAAAHGVTDAKGVGEIVPDARRISLPGCPMNAENITATIVHYLTFNEWPPTDGAGRPLFAYGGLLHNQCERRAHFEFGEFVAAWGDEAAQKGWCLYKVGCKGPNVYANCPTARFASRVSWPVRAGTGCIGCTMPSFWDEMGPAYTRLPGPIPFAPTISADQVGVAMVAGIATVVVVHGGASYVRARRGRAARTRAMRAAAQAAGGAGTVADAAALPDGGGEAPRLEPAASPPPVTQPGPNDAGSPAEEDR
jgi:hydrogenase small subunit